MNFSNVLNGIIKKIGCTSKEICTISGLSPSFICRLRKEDTVPKRDSNRLNKLIDALISISNEDITSDIEKLIKTTKDNSVDIELFRNNLNYLIDALNINVADLSRHIGYDASYISKIRSGTRTPSDVIELTKSISKYIATNYNLDKIDMSISYKDSNDEASIYSFLTEKKD